MKKILLRGGIAILLGVCIYMIYVGSMGRSSSPIQESFVYHVGDEISMDPSTYLKGCTVPDKVQLDFSHVDTKHVGTYDVIVDQPGDTYTFSIIIK